jgi:diadenosine tetraphosphate (Ap4A) HIT family hydrolase
MNILNKYNVRSEEQKIRMEEADKENICPFCPDGLKVIHRLPIEIEIGRFFVTKSAFPYEGTNYHYLIVSKEHITEPAQISGEDWQDIGKAFNWVLESAKMTGGGMFLRFGDMKKNGSSVAHVHLHVISGNSIESDPEEIRESLKVKLGYKKK